MSDILPFPGGRVASRGGQHSRSGQTLGAVHPTRAGMISWMRRASCECCGRATLAGRARTERMTLCRQCNPQNVA
jgi:hypothetical protein